MRWARSPTSHSTRPGLLKVECPLTACWHALAGRGWVGEGVPHTLRARDPAPVRAPVLRAGWEVWRGLGKIRALEGVNRRTHSRVSFSLYPWGEEREKVTRRLFVG